MEDLFYFDIETCGSYKNFDEFNKLDVVGANLFKDKYKRMNWNEKYTDIHEAYLKNASIISTYGKICCISFGYLDKDVKRISSFYGPDEKSNVERFNNLLKKIEKKNFKLCGFRILYFDIPWILHKLHKYNIVPADIIYLYDKKNWNYRIVDLSDDWKGKFQWPGSFNEALYELNIKTPKDLMDGSQVHRYYHQGMFDDIKTYCEKDVEASIEMGDVIYNS